MIFEFTSVEALLIKSAVKIRLDLYKQTGLTIPDCDEKELNSILEKVDESFNFSGRVAS